MLSDFVTAPMRSEAKRPRGPPSRADLLELTNTYLSAPGSALA
ncbi:hypothetical protein RBWH47_01329 [Rhodopirellula baltica WH47]|uniref:Uncharacterized protein n=1 Tax=Rhodopirellula baltica WH47 TaxID=991778 RepID=F2AN39_RHOBT|nr:hypothetical protein RBWH47_01329 [Rhodopirellula baltica WH47]